MMMMLLQKLSRVQSNVVIKLSTLLLLFVHCMVIPAQQPQDLGVVKPQAFAPSPIAVPPFEGGAAGTPDLFSQVIERDLFLSGFFRSPENPDFAREVHSLDQKANKVHYADWHRLGVSYVVKGKYDFEGNQINAEFRTYDTTAGTYIFGRRYEKYPRNNMRQLAHRMSNDIIKRITSFDGVAHTQLAVVTEAGSGRGGAAHKEVAILDADGANKRQITSDRNLAATPTWGARGTELYYTTYKDYNPDLAGIYLDGSHAWFVSRRAGFNLSPNWSEKRQLITLTLSKDGNSEIYTMNRAGKDLQRLTFTPGIDSSPVWSPNGDQIAFTSDRNGGPQIYVMDYSGVNVRQLTRQGSYNDGAAWSPLGDRIAFSSRINNIFQIFTINVDGTDLRQLTNGNYNSEDPTFAPNGWLIGYTSDRTGKKQVHTMFIDGRPIAQLTDGAACYSANWSPLFP